jgi:drug/metabolite transporter (DMT)-like permease
MTRLAETRLRAYTAWVIVCIVWGTTYLAIRICLETIPPFVMGGVRYVLAGGLLAAGLAMRGERLPGPRAWLPLGILGFFLIGIGNGGVVWAEQTVTSGLTAVLVATSPFWMVGVDSLVPPRVPLTARRVVGLLIGFAGIVMLVWPEIQLGGGRTFLFGVMSAQIACVGWAIGSAYSRRRGHGAAKDENVLATAAFQMLFGGICLLVAALVTREFSHLTFNVRTASALVYLIVVGAIGGFAAYAYALKHLPVATVSLYAYINPVIAVILGTLILSEPFNARMALAAGVVLAGIVLVRSEK